MAVAAVAAVTACSPTTSLTAAPSSARSTDLPSRAPVASLLSNADLVDARRFRESFGLRADDAWIEAVAANPQSEQGRLEYGVPLLPAELADLRSRTPRRDVEELLRWYGARTPETWAGMFQDQRAGGVLVAQFTDAALHRQRLRAVLPPGARVDVRQVAYSIRDLEARIDEVERRASAMESLGAELFTAEINIVDNTVDVLVNADDRAVTGEIRALFGAPPWMQVVWNGHLTWRGQRGDLDVRVTDPAGKPMDGYACSLESDRVDVGEGLIHVGKTGHCRFRDYPATDYRLRVYERTDDGYAVVSRVPITITPRTVTRERVTVAW